MTTPPQAPIGTPRSALTHRMLLARNRVSRACTTCKQRKVKCDGEFPCRNCRDRDQESTCSFQPTHRRQTRRNHSTSFISAQSPGQSSGEMRTGSPSPVVPKDSGLHHDKGGKAIFIGDCAPLSFFNTIRSLVAFCGSPIAFESVNIQQHSVSVGGDGNEQRPAIVEETPDQQLVDTFEYRMATAAVLDAWSAREIDNMHQGQLGYLATSLSRAISILSRDPDSALQQTLHLQQQVLSQFADTSLDVLRVFLLMTLSFLQNNQLNTSFLLLGLAGRLAYALGIHRTEINRNFVPEIAYRRTRLWKSLRVLDLNAAIVLGRPPATSDIDCSVNYDTSEEINGPDLLNAHVQILKITEDVVVEVYSKQKLSPTATNAIAKRLGTWSEQWSKALTGLIDSGNRPSAISTDRVAARGATRIMSAYYYAVMLSTRPFLMYELHIRMSASIMTVPPVQPSPEDPSERRAIFARSCLSASKLLVNLHHKSRLPVDPILASNFLFVTGLVLGAGYLGYLGDMYGDSARQAVMLLQQLDRYDQHAEQYAKITDEMLKVAQEEHKNREERIEKERRRESNQLFGLPMEHEAELSDQDANMIEFNWQPPFDFDWNADFLQTYADVDPMSQVDLNTDDTQSSHKSEIFGQNYTVPVIGQQEIVDFQFIAK